jgi:hypothetical protein
MAVLPDPNCELDKLFIAIGKPASNAINYGLAGIYFGTIDVVSLPSTLILTPLSAAFLTAIWSVYLSKYVST